MAGGTDLENADEPDLESLEAKLGDPENINEGPDDPPPVEEGPEEAEEPGPPGGGAGGPAGGLLVRLCHAAEDHYGLRVREFDGPGAPARWGPVHHVHAQGSFHYQHRAADISGLEQNMQRFGAWVARNNTPRIKELIHNPGSSIKNGQHVPASFWGAQTWRAHRNHVHLAI